MCCLESRLHELGITSGDLASFTTEGKGYTGLASGRVPPTQVNKWNKEFAKTYATNFKNNSYLW